jgi:hypothetical protein
MHVRAFVDPVMGIAGPPLEFERPERATLADILALVPLQNEALRPHLRVKLGGILIDPSLYHRVLPKRDAFLTVVLPVHGGNNNLLGTIAAVALVGAALFVSGGFAAPFLGSAFAAGSLGANLLAGGLSIAASLLLQGLDAPTQAAPTEGSAAKEIGVASAQNSFEPGAYLPRVLGTRKIAPPMVMPPYTEVVSDATYVTAVYGLAGPHSIAGLKIGSADITSADDVQVEIRQGFAADTALTLVTGTVIEEGINLELSRFSTLEDGFTLDPGISPNTPVWHRLETKQSPDAFSLMFVCDQGMGQLASASRAISAVRVRMRQKGNVSWINLPELAIAGKAIGRPGRFLLNFLWTAPANMPGSVTENSGGDTQIGWYTKYNTVTPSAGPTWTADTYFTGNVVDWRNQQNYDVYLNTNTFPKGRWEIEVIRGYTVRLSQYSVPTHAITGPNADRNDFFQSASSGGNQVLAENQTEFVDHLLLAAAQSRWNEYPFDVTGQPTTLIAIRAKNRSIEQVSCIASGLTEDWNGSTWVADQATSNPASWYREVLSSDLNAEPVPDSLIDMENLQDWHEWCEAKGHEVNAIVQGQSVVEVLSLTAQAGFARPRFGATHGVIIDRPRSPVGLVTQRTAAGFAFEKPFGRLPHALKVNLTDEANDYKVREFVVYDDGYAAAAGSGLLEATRFESVTYHGITAEAQAQARAKRDMRFARHRSRLINFSMDIEHLEFQLGDLVYVETDILGQIGGRGRVSSITQSGGLVTGLMLDEERDFTDADDNSLQRAVAMRLRDGTVRVERVTSDDSDLKALKFTTPFVMPTSGGDLIVPGTLVATGTLGHEAHQVLIWDMAPGPNLTCQITAIPYAVEGVYRVFQGAAAAGLVMTGTASGEGGIEGYAAYGSAAVALTAAAATLAALKGSAAATVRITVAAAPGLATRGSGVAAITLTSAAEATADIVSTASAAIEITAAANGETAPFAGGTASIVITATATSTRTRQATAAATIAIAASAAAAKGFDSGFSAGFA